jgi:integrase/recombinase XerD
MIEDTTVRDLLPTTQRWYVHAVAKFGRLFGRSPDKFDPEDVGSSVAFPVCTITAGIAGGAGCR